MKKIKAKGQLGFWTLVGILADPNVPEAEKEKLRRLAKEKSK